VRGEGVHLFDDQGHRYFDAISSWWACALGHGRPEIVAAIQQQAALLQHSILGNLAHPNAAALARRLARLMPTPDRRVLFAADGSSSVEAALKIALQYRPDQGQGARPRFAALEDAYHGDTLAAVGVGYLPHFHKPFESLLTPALRLAPFRPFAETARVLEDNARSLAAVIVEPLCQCAAGMRIYPADYLKALAAKCVELDILQIVDEIATGFGRTGTIFAFEQAGIDPDLVCVGKALSAGYLPISAVIVKDRIYAQFSDEPTDHTFYHGHTFCGNPLAAAAALAALDIYDRDDIPARARRLGQLMMTRLQPLRDDPRVKEVRGIGAIAAVELKTATPRTPQQVRRAFLEKGLLARPLGSVLYLMPPLVTPDDVALAACDALAAVVRESA